MVYDGSEICSTPTAKGMYGEREGGRREGRQTGSMGKSQPICCQSTPQSQMSATAADGPGQSQKTTSQDVPRNYLGCHLMLCRVHHPGSCNQEHSTPLGDAVSLRRVFTATANWCSCVSFWT